MRIKNIQCSLVVFCFLANMGMTGCQTSTAPAGIANTETAENRSLAPRRVDIRGSIIMSRYNQGQVMLEVEGSPSPDTRYDRAYVLVVPTTQIIGIDGQAISLSELRQGQNVAILLRNGGKGNFVGLGVARKVWIEDIF
ncbi:hypothetical protein I2I11_15615 [Pontibacter sp. 172403-2]|uniref:hypothetical protein n=1 Tax=Pontibacter rufus TaxID=2791028 RepID=UPI0018B0143E|nr:hypothetical protein [Pontibacter sp. 172403-2]MBF9254733.1 hypothetical protein [Pontibacter sp. 172403-2]